LSRHFKFTITNAQLAYCHVYDDVEVAEEDEEKEKKEE